METQDFDPRDLVASLIEGIAPSARAKRLAVTPLVYGNVPPRLSGDPSQLSQILSCLLVNAVTFTECGQIVLSLTRDIETDTHFIMRCAVSDTGQGVALEVQEKFFNSIEFDSPNPSSLGRAQQLVAGLGGRLCVESTPSQGATFWFSARFRKAGSVVDAASAPPPSQPSAPSQAQRLVRNRTARILVAEDDPVNQQATLHHLGKLGYLADVVENGREVLETLKTTSYDVVLIDCQMPVMDGYDATREIRRRENDERHTIIIALTSLTSQTNRNKCRSVGMDDYLVKPIDGDALAKRLSYWLGTIATPPPASTSFEGSERFVMQLIPIFLEDAPKRIEGIRNALLHQNAEALEGAAHTLKSSSALMNATTMSQLCATLEMRGRQGWLDDSEDTLQQLEDEFARIREKLSFHSQKEQESLLNF